MKIGLISDTHGRLPSQVFAIFEGVELILHAGDIGSEQVLIELQTLAPVHAVYGNVDEFSLATRLKRIECIEAQSLHICLTHIVNSPKATEYELFKQDQRPQVVVFGHTHQAEQFLYRDILFVNPGSACLPRHTKKPSVGMLTIAGGKAKAEFIFF